MADNIRITLSEHQRAYFAAMAAETQRIEQARNTALTAIVAGVYDPQQYAQWVITPTELVYTPPAERELALVPDEASG